MPNVFPCNTAPSHHTWEKRSNVKCLGEEGGWCGQILAFGTIRCPRCKQEIIYHGDRHSLVRQQKVISERRQANLRASHVEGHMRMASGEFERRGILERTPKGNPSGRSTSTFVFISHLKGMSEQSGIYSRLGRGQQLRAEVLHRFQYLNRRWHACERWPAGFIRS